MACRQRRVGIAGSVRLASSLADLIRVEGEAAGV